MKELYDDYKIIDILDRRNNSRYYRIRCTICGHVKECSIGNIIRQDNHHSCKNCHEDYYKNLIGKTYGDYRCEDVEYVSKQKGYIANMICTICGHKVKIHAASNLTKFHNAYTCEIDYHKSLIGKRYGDLIVTGLTGGYRENAIKYDCKCAICGVKSVEIMASLKRNIQHGNHCFKALPPDELKSIISSRYRNIYERCNNPNNANYSKYGGRGIKLLYKSAVELYLDFADEIREYAKSHDITDCTFDRIDVNGNYEKSNLRIASQTIQSTNTTRKKIFIIEKDGTRIISDSAMACGRFLGLNGRSMGNVVRGSSKSCGGWRLYRIVDNCEDIDEVVNNEGVTTKLIIS